jgi:hypothetical protein
VYFSTNYDADDEVGRSGKKSLGVSNGNRDYPVLKGRLHFVKFETSKIHDCLDFIQTKQLHLGGMCAPALTCYCYFGNYFFLKVTKLVVHLEPC